jgi:hypothetical protein
VSADLIALKSNLIKIAYGGIFDAAYKLGWLQGSRKRLKEKKFWLRGLDLNQRPPGYEDEQQTRGALILCDLARD